MIRIFHGACLLAIGFVITGCALRGAKARSCEMREGNQIQGADFQVKWQVLNPEPSQTAAAPTVLIFPPTGGVTTLERWYAEKICDRGLRAVIVTGWTGDDDYADDFERHKRHFTRAGRAFDVLAQVFPGRHHVIGTSLGGLYALSFLTKKTSIDRAVLITAGAPFSSIVSESDHDTLTGVKKRRMATFGLSTDEDYRKRIEATLVDFDDLERMTADLGRATAILQVVGLNDLTVPTRYQQLIAEKLKPRKVIEINASHFWAIVRAYWSHSSEIVEFIINKN